MLQLLVYTAVISWTTDQIHCQSQTSYTQPKVFPNDCPETQFFDVNRLSCTACPNGLIQDESNPMRCHCPIGHKKTVGYISTEWCDRNYKTFKSDYGTFAMTCTPCPPNHVPTPDGWGCIKCVDTIIGAASTCVTCTEPDQMLHTRSAFGAIEQEQTCQQCRAVTAPIKIGADSFCAPCTRNSEDEKDCKCETHSGTMGVRAGGVCFVAASDRTYLTQSVDAKVKFSDAGDQTADSLFFENNLKAANLLCTKGNNTACNLLSNMCVLNQYSSNPGNTVPNACTLYYQQIDKQTSRLPRLYTTDARAELQRATLPTSYTFNPDHKNSRLRLLAAVYNINGQFERYANLTDGFIQLCPASPTEYKVTYLFGQSYDQKCDIPIDWLWNKFETKLFDIKLEYEFDTTDANNAYAGATQLYNVPILNTAYKNERGERPNVAESQDRWFLTYRMFVVDNVAGVEQVSPMAKYVRYASNIQLLVTVQNTKNGHILVPYFKIDYATVSLLQLSDQTATVPVTFSVRYYGSEEIGMRHDNDLEITMGVLCSLGLLWSLLAAWSWSRRAGKYMIDLATVFQFLLYLAASLGDVFFIVMLSTAIYICFAYKMQLTVVYVILSPSQEYGCMVCVVVAFILKFIELLHNRIEQLLTETFFIDWERPRGHVLPDMGQLQDHEPSIQDANNRPPTSITIWRTYMVANEWNELQNYRKTSVPLQLFLMAFFLIVLNFQAFTIVQPGFQLDAIPPYVSDSRLNRVAVVGALYLIIGFVQWAINVIIGERVFDDHFRNFMDLCSISNISVLALTRAQFGYYIHGRSVHGHSDANMKEMNMMLQRERDNLTGHRGLEPNSEVQCFIVSLPNAFRQKLNTVREPLRSSSTSTRDTNMDASTAKMATVIQVHESMNNYLTAFIEQRTVGNTYTIKDRSPLEAILDIEFEDTSQVGVFHRDTSDMSYSRAFLYGNEWVNLSFDCLLLIVLDMITHDYVLAICLAYVIISILTTITEKGFTNNLVKSSLVDDRFLI